jgi:hypothetical protein
MASKKSPRRARSDKPFLERTVAIVGVIGGLVAIMAAVRGLIPSGSPEATIMYPLPGKPVGRMVRLQGSVVGRLKSTDVWVVTRREKGGDVIPKAVLTFTGDSFEQDVPLGGNPGSLDICLVATDRDASRMFADLQQSSRASNEWHGMPVPRTASLLLCEGYMLKTPDNP